MRTIIKNGFWCFRSTEKLGFYETVKSLVELSKVNNPEVEELNQKFANAICEYVEFRDSLGAKTTPGDIAVKDAIRKNAWHFGYIYVDAMVRCVSNESLLKSFEKLKSVFETFGYIKGKSQIEFSAINNMLIACLKQLEGIFEQTQFTHYFEEIEKTQKDFEKTLETYQKEQRKEPKKTLNAYLEECDECYLKLSLLLENLSVANDEDDTYTDLIDQINARYYSAKQNTNYQLDSLIS